MKQKYLAALAALTLCGSMQAQDIYKVEMLSGSDLNGTARFVGMGGAMNALGADLSTMGTNPAAIGMYRRSDVAFTGSTTSQPNGREFGEINKVRTSFDQAGFVYACKLNSDVRFVNIGFNYQKKRNLKNFIGLNNIGLQGGMSQSWQMMDLAMDLNGNWLDLSSESDDYRKTTPLAVVGYDAQMIAPIYDENGRVTGYEPSFADSYDYRRAQWGGVQQFDFNLSMNWQDQVYAGLTVGAYNVDIHSRTEYGEVLYDADNNTDYYGMLNAESLTGVGVDVKLGVILRPIEESPFRLGFSVSTPTFYNLTQHSYIYMNSPYGYTAENGQEYDRTEADAEVGNFDYRIYTPWKFNLSMATTVAGVLALDAEYEFSGTQGAQVRYPDYDDYWYDSYYSSSTKDKALGKEIDDWTQAVHTFRVGAELRLAPGVFGRVGYNYVSSPFKKDAFLNQFTDSPSYAYSTNTDYVNLGSINRVTAGLGFRSKHFYADLAYQYQQQEADVYAFHVPEANGVTNRLQGQKVDLNRHNFMLTLGYKF